MEYVVNNNVITFCNTLFKIVQTFPPYLIKTHHIICYKHTTRTTSSIILHNSSKSMNQVCSKPVLIILAPREESVGNAFGSVCPTCNSKTIALIFTQEIL